ARRPREVAEAEAEDDRAAHAPRGAQPARDAVDEADEDSVDLLARAARAPERALRPDRAPPAADPDGTRVAVVRQRVHVPAGGAAEQPDERLLRQVCDLGDGRHADGAELRGGRGADAPEPLDRQRPEEGELAPRRDDEQPVRLGDAARDL